MFEYNLPLYIFNRLKFFILFLGSLSLVILGYRVDYEEFIAHQLPLALVGLAFVQISFIGQSMYCDPLVYIYSLPLALNANQVLNINNARDISMDTKAGITTIPSIIGHTYAFYYQICLVLGQ
eukprot:gene381-448_t